MLLCIIRKEILNGFLSLRLPFTLLLVTAVMVSAAFLFLEDYQQQLADYDRNVKDNLQKEGQKLMGEILANGPVAVKLSWEAMHRGLNMSLEESAQLGADYFGLVAATDDFREGTGAFLNKTKPKFNGK